MRHALLCRGSLLALLGLLAAGGPSQAATGNELAHKAESILKANCHRCHGRDGAVEGGLNYVLDRAKLIARRKVLPGKAEKSPLYQRIARGKMPPPGEPPRPSAADLAILKQWIDAGAPSAHPAPPRTIVRESDVNDWILADLDKQEKRSRRFARYFSLVPLANAGAGADELETYRRALGKLLNSLSWHPRITLPKPIDPAGLVLRIDLRNYLWDANSWNRLLADYPYGILFDTAAARAVLVSTANRMPCVRADWFIANASRAPLYYDLLQLPTNASELERQLRVDVAQNIQQERVARAGFNGSGISRNNRVLERHDAQTGAYWRTYDFEAVPQNLLERDTLLPDRRNVFAYPLGPGFGERGFQHAAGEIIFNLPNGLHGYLLVNANNVRQDKGATAIVSDPKRPDRTVRGHFKSAVHAVFAPDGRHVLSAGDDGTMRLWNADSGKQVRLFAVGDNGVTRVAWSADGRYALSGGGDAVLRLWDVGSGKEIKAFRKHKEALVAAAFLSKGRQTISVSRDAGVQSWSISPFLPDGDGNTKKPPR